MLGISDRAKNFHGSPLRKTALMLEKAGVDKSIISFGGGAPSLAPPKEVIDYVVQKLREEPQASTAYCSTPGPPKVRELISESLKIWEDVDVTADEIMLTVGGTEGLFATLLTLVNPGDEVITTDPCYLGYMEPIKLVGGKQKTVPIYWKEDFQVKEEKLKEAITKKTKAFLLCSPDNPTGGIQEKKSLKAIVEICEDKKIWLITDDIYKNMVFEGKFVNSRKFGGYENTITCCSFSKVASLPGVRVGYTYGPEKTINKIAELKQATTLTAPKLGSIFVEAFLENKTAVKRKYLKEVVVPTYRKRKDCMAKMLRKYTDFSFSMPKGAFYFFPEINRDDVKFCDRLLKEKKVVAVPGRHFGKNGERHVRLTFVSETEERIEEGVRKISEML
ncbi:MAG: pyridoxal phosphate-dependent aminotransferase [archaeon]